MEADGGDGLNGDMGSYEVLTTYLLSEESTLNRCLSSLCLTHLSLDFSDQNIRNLFSGRNGYGEGNLAGAGIERPVP